MSSKKSTARTTAVPSKLAKAKVVYKVTGECFGVHNEGAKICAYVVMKFEDDRFALLYHPRCPATGCCASLSLGRLMEPSHDKEHDYYISTKTFFHSNLMDEETQYKNIDSQADLNKIVEVLQEIKYNTLVEEVVQPGVDIEELEKKAKELGYKLVKK